MTADSNQTNLLRVRKERRMHSILEQNARDLLAYFARRLRSHEDAADLLSETLLVAWRRLSDLPGDDERARMWLFATARNTLLNHQRGERRHHALADRLRNVTLAIHQPGPGEDDDVRDVRDAVNRLSPDLKELVTLVHWDGFSLAEAAEIIEIPASTARGRYAKARATLRAALLAVHDQ